MKHLATLIALLMSLPLLAADSDPTDLPPRPQVEAALRQHINVQTATTGILLEQGNRNKLESGSYEFNLRAGGAQRNISSTGQVLREWDVAIERPLRLFNKGSIDSDIGAESISRAEFALGDARHEAARALLHLWFNWQREQAQAGQWQQQVDILAQQVQMTEKRMLAGDAPRMELNQAEGALAQARVSLQQADMRARLAASELLRPFPELALPPQPVLATPQPVDQALAYWQERILSDNHELRVMQSDSRIQQLQAERSSADRLPDPTVGLRYSNEKEGDEKVTGVYVSVPLSFGLRGTQAQIARHQAEIAHQREAATKRRLEGDIYAAYTHAVNGYQIWQQADRAASSVQQNADLVARAYTLGESSLSDTLNARRFALESRLAATLAQLDANEARYRLLLDAHQLWPLDEHDGEPHP